MLCQRELGFLLLAKKTNFWTGRKEKPLKDLHTGFNRTSFLFLEVPVRDEVV